MIYLAMTRPMLHRLGPLELFKLLLHTTRRVGVA